MKKLMSNLLAKTARSIPYNGFLRPVCKSVTSAILFQQLEYWFDKQGSKKFYKFLEPCKNSAYQKEDSWIEELNFSKDEFRAAFDNIGVRYFSKKEYDLNKDDKFQGKFYCSYHDKIKGLTWYMRNEEKINSVLNELSKISVNRKGQSTGLGKSEKSTPVNSESQFTEIDKVNPHYTEITTKTTTETTQKDPEKLTSSKFIEYKNRLRSIDEKFNLSYLESSKANQYYEQAQKKYEELNSNKSFSEFFESILTKLEKLTSQKLDRFAFKQGFTIESLVKFDLQGCAKVEAWFNDCYPSGYSSQNSQYQGYDKEQLKKEGWVV